MPQYPDQVAFPAQAEAQIQASSEEPKAVCSGLAAAMNFDDVTGIFRETLGRPQGVSNIVFVSM